jgi:hypothetical protein
VVYALQMSHLPTLSHVERFGVPSRMRMKEQQLSAEMSVHSNPVTRVHIRVCLNRLQNRSDKLKYRQRGAVMFYRFRYICGGEEGVEVRTHSFFTPKLCLCGRLQAPHLPAPRKYTTNPIR